MRINTNIASLNAQRHLWNTSQSVNRSMERLSSGLRINRAADDAAGLAISEGLKSDIRALTQASRNAADGVSMVQIAEGAMDEINSIVVRMRELAMQASTDTMGDTERGYLNDEYTALMEEINRISDSTEFNGINLLNGSVGDANIIVGLGTLPSDAITVDLSTDVDTSAGGLNLVATSVDTSANALAAVDEIEAAIGIVVTARASFGASQNRLESAMRSISNSIENLSAANSRIRDADLAYETSVMTSKIGRASCRERV